MKDLGKLEYFLNFEVRHRPYGTFLSQIKYMLAILAETENLVCGLAATLIEQCYGLTKVVSSLIDDPK